MFSHILTPLDGSTLAASALPHVVAIARATGARITLIRVLEGSGDSLLGNMNPFNWQMQKRQAQTYLDEVAGQLLHTIDSPIQVELLEGSAAVQIVDYAQRTDADLVVLSSHGQGGLSGWHTSSVAHKVIQRAGISVLLARSWRPQASADPAQLGEEGYRRILAPLDGSPRAECVLPVATALAEHADALWLVHVVNRPELFQRLPLTAEDQVFLEQIVTRNQQQAERYFEQLQARLVPTPRTRVLTDNNVTAMLHRFVAEEEIDLVLLSAHGFSGQAQWPFGSLTQSFIEYGETPLLIMQDMPMCISSAVRTAVQSVVQPVRTASVADLTERLPDSQHGSGTLSSSIYTYRVDQNYACAF